MPRPVKLLMRFGLIVVVGVASIAMLTSLLVPAVAELPSAASFSTSSKIALPALVEGSTVLDMHGDPIGELIGAENRQIVSLDDISEELRSTVLAVEDADFYEHDGVSARSIMRAFRANSDAGGVSQGGSTITQQLVKLSLVGDERSFTRKLKEASLALQLEQQYCETTSKQECKDRILEQYLNQVYLGRGAYGVEAAAQTYFGRSASEVGWAESAVLASLIRSPSAYDPVRYPDVARQRREIVVRRMMAEGLIGQTEADLINAAPLPTDVQRVRSSTTAQDLSYFERHVRDELLDAEWLAPTRELRRFLIFNGGLKITSTMDPRAQFLAAVASNESPVKAQNPDSMAVVVAVEPATGAVRAAVGETTVEGKGVVELATPAVGRSPGSSFKTFTLIAALEEGYGLRSTISAAPAPRSLYDDWNLPRTVSTWPSGCRGGSTDLTRATASSNNCAFVRLQAAVGGEQVVDVARRLGITTLADDAGDIPSLTLGSASVRPLEDGGRVRGDRERRSVQRGPLRHQGRGPRRERALRARACRGAGDTGRGGPTGDGRSERRGVRRYLQGRCAAGPAPGGGQDRDQRARRRRQRRCLVRRLHA
ncbi:MAG: transglycosylase domain-containing protein [Microthrixaceae bacterium]